MSLVPIATAFEEKAKGKKQRVLDEDLYVENIEKIIVRDFFPDLPKLKAKIQSEYDGTKDTPSVCATPSHFETPSSNSVNKDLSNDAEIFPEDKTKISDDQLKKMSLTQYMNKYTSEDNASFNEIMEDAQRKQREKYAWLYKNEQLQIEDNPESKKPLMWNYVAKNSLMYVPDGVELSESEKVEKYSKKKQEIVHQNTRFVIQPFNHPIEVQRSTYNKMEGKIGLDGKEILPSRTPTIGGYKFMATPSPAPGVDASPLMTWGEIEGTPYKLDGSETPRLPGPSFKIPELPKRDRLLHQLTDKISKSHRAKKEEALRQAAATFANSPRSLMTRTERIQSMSPAAQRLLSNKLRLHSSSPFGGSLTPTPGRTLYGSLTPKSSPKILRSPLKKKNTLSTDNLLKLPVKRSKAADFFDP